MRKLIAAILLAQFAFCVPACLAQANKHAAPLGMTPGALPVIVYKTKKDYRNLVPVTLSDDKSKIVSYPDPKDFKPGGSGWLPVPLHKGYFYDKRGINKNTAFLKLTYTQYAKLLAAPSIEDLFVMIEDKDPFTEFCNCGKRKDFEPGAIKKLNALIDHKKLTCK